MDEVLHIVEAKAAGDFLLDVAFNDGVRKRVNLRPLLWGPVMQPLLDPDFFAQVRLDDHAGTVVWPNDADFAPEALYELPEERAADRPAAA